MYIYIHKDMNVYILYIYIYACIKTQIKRTCPRCIYGLHRTIREDLLNPLRTAAGRMMRRDIILRHTRGPRKRSCPRCSLPTWTKHPLSRWYFYVCICSLLLCSIIIIDHFPSMSIRCVLLYIFSTMPGWSVGVPFLAAQGELPAPTGCGNCSLVSNSWVVHQGTRGINPHKPTAMLFHSRDLFLD